MLVVHSSSSCDVCLEGYDGSTKTPHVISCGHAFCLACLQSLNRRQCPLCRATFEIPEVRRLHIDQSPDHSTSTSSSIPSTAVPDATGEGTEDHKVRYYQGAITRIVREGDSMSTVRGTIDEVRSWLKTQPEDQHVNLRASFLLLYRFMEYQTKNKSLELEVEKLEEEIQTVEASCEKLRAQLKSDAEAASEKYDTLLRTSHEERLRAVSMEKSKRDHAEKMEREWREKYEGSTSECKRLQALVDNLRRRNPLPPPPMPVEDNAIYLTDDSTSSEDGQKSPSIPSPEPVLPIRLATGLPRALDTEERFRLSPVPPTPVNSEEVFNALKTDNNAERKAPASIAQQQLATPAQRVAVPASPAPVPEEVTRSPNLSRSLLRTSHTELSHKNRTRRRDRSNSVQETGLSSYGNITGSGSSRGNSVSALRTPLPPPGDGVPHEHLRGQLYDLLDQKPKHTASSPAYAILHFATPTIPRTALPRARSTQVLNPPTPKMHGSPIIQARPPQRRRNTASAGMGGVDTYALPYTSPPPPPPPLPTLGKDKSQTYERPAVLSSASGAALAAEQRRRELRSTEPSPQGQTPKTEHREVYPIVTPPPNQPSHTRSQSQPNTLQRRPSGGSSKGKGRPQLLPPTGLDLWALSV